MIVAGIHCAYKQHNYTGMITDPDPWAVEVDI